MRYLWLLLVTITMLVGCGGGGGGGGASISVVGRVIWLKTGGAPDPAASVQIGDISVQTDNNGDFTATVAAGATSVLVVYTPTAGAPVSFRFETGPLNTTTNLGDLWIGPEKITVTGHVVDASNGSDVAGSLVNLAGRNTASGANGKFSLAEVAYDSSAPGAFFLLEGRISKTGYITRPFEPDQTPVAGIADLGDLILSPDTGGLPPPSPYNVSGQVNPANLAPGTVVTVISGITPVRQSTVGSDAKYGFFLPSGTYTLTFHNPANGKNAPDESVTLPSTNVVITRNVTLQ